MGRNRDTAPITDVTQAIYQFYQMGSDEIATLADSILDQAKDAYQSQLSSEARKYGSAKSARPASGSSLSALKSQANTDAKSIANTFNRELRNKIEDLYGMNPRGNRNYYAANLDAWAKSREEYKGRQIALNTEQNARTLATSDFRDKNRAIIGKTYYLYDGAAPVSDECKFRFRQGIVDSDFVDSHPTPAHVNCPHVWRQTGVKKLSAKDLQDLWVG